MSKSFSELVADYLKGTKLEEATPQQLSNAESYAKCYLWYIEKMKVAPDTAAMSSDIWINKYALHSSDGICLENTPEDTWDREATALANEEIRTNPTNKDFDFWYKEFMSALTGWKYSPQGSGIYALGNPYVKASVSNCFVAPSPKDNLESIFDTAKYMARTYASRGGVGINLNGLRPYGAFTNNAAKTSTGAASFMDFYSYVTGMIGQDGRRGALMECMSIHHPDIIRFIEMKRDKPLQSFFDKLLGVGININDWEYSPVSERLKSTSYANVSVMLSDEFMNAVKNKADYEQRFTFKGDATKYPPISNMVNAEEIWNTLMFSAWKSAEPGILFWDLISRESTSDYYGQMVTFTFTDPMTGEEVTIHDLDFCVSATNPCGEQPLPADDSCCLGTHYLCAFVNDPWTDNASFDFAEYERVLRIAVRAQDNIKGIDAASLSIQSQRAMALLLRRIGLGNTGLSDCMASLGLRYDTEEAIAFVEKLYAFLRDVAYDESVNLAKEKGSFLAFDWEKHKNSPFIQRLPKALQNLIKKYGIRNIALLTQAPNGSMSILMRNCSSGSEPMFLLSSTRNVKVQGSTGEGVQYTLYHQAVQDALDAGWTKEQVAAVFVAAEEINPRMRVRMQGKMQGFIDSAISITTNLKSTATVEEVRDLYEMAHEYGCKGFTVYRDGCRTGVLNAIKEEVEVNKKVSRPKVTDVDIHKTRYKDKNYMILVGKTDGKAIEIFGGEEAGLSLPTQYASATLTKKSRGHYTLEVQLSDDEEDILKVNNIGARFPAQDVMTLTRMLSLSLRNGISVSDIVEQLTKASSALYDAPAVFARVLKQYISDEELISKEKAKGKPCPECGEPLDFRRESGCLVEVCTSCAFSNSKCG